MWPGSSAALEVTPGDGHTASTPRRTVAGHHRWEHHSRPPHPHLPGWVDAENRLGPTSPGRGGSPSVARASTVRGVRVRRTSPLECDDTSAARSPLAATLRRRPRRGRGIGRRRAQGPPLRDHSREARRRVKPPSRLPLATGGSPCGQPFPVGAVGDGWPGAASSPSTRVMGALWTPRVTLRISVGTNSDGRCENRQIACIVGQHRCHEAPTGQRETARCADELLPGEGSTAQVIGPPAHGSAYSATLHRQERDPRLVALACVGVPGPPCDREALGAPCEAEAPLCRQGALSPTAQQREPREAREVGQGVTLCPRSAQPGRAGGAECFAHTASLEHRLSRRTGKVPIQHEGPGAGQGAPGRVGAGGRRREAVAGHGHGRPGEARLLPQHRRVRVRRSRDPSVQPARDAGVLRSPQRADGRPSELLQPGRGGDWEMP